MGHPTIAEILTIKPGTVIPSAKGVVEAVGEFYEGKQQNPDKSERAWSLQTLIVKDPTGKIAVEIGRSWPATEQHVSDKVGFNRIGEGVVFLAHQKARGGLSGLKVEQQDGQTMLRVSNSGEFTFVQAPIEPPEQIPGAEVPEASGGSGEVAERPPAAAGGGESQPRTALTPTVEPGQPPQSSPGGRNIGDLNNPGSGTDAPPATSISPWLPVSKTVNAYANLYELCFRRVVNGLLPRVLEQTNVSLSVAQVQDATRCIFEAFISELRDSGAALPEAPLPERKISPPAK